VLRGVLRAAVHLHGHQLHRGHGHWGAGLRGVQQRGAAGQRGDGAGDQHRAAARAQEGAGCWGRRRGWGCW
jgi:hypothetical protein